jgi:hypothetical protein
MGVLGKEQTLESPLLGHPPQLAGIRARFGGEDRDAEFHARTVAELRRRALP